MTTTMLTFRELGPDDTAVLDAVFAGLSPLSRYLRFHNGSPAMLPSTRSALAAVDGRRHVAVAAFADGGPVGIARLVAMGSAQADLAVEVVDGWQHRGLGGRLVRAVLATGRRAGFTEVSADVLTDNVPMLRLLARLFPVRTTTVDGPETRIHAVLEDTMFIETRTVQHRDDLLAEARDRRLAREGRPTRERRPRRPVLTRLFPALGGVARGGAA
jgi:GNAT superfamily N-acetyltransferase